MPKPKSKGHRAAKHSAEEHADSPSSRRSKRRAAEHGSRAASATPAVTLSAEERFKLKNSGEFDDAEQNKEKQHVEIKDESTGDNNQPLQSTAGPSTAIVHHARSPSVHHMARNVFENQSSQVVDRENVLDTLLSHDLMFDMEMTRHAVHQILHDARESAGAGNELGVAYVEARIVRLRQKGISSSRLSEVVQLFQSSLRDLVNRLSSHIEAIGSVPMPPTSIPAGTTRHSLGQHKDSHVQINSSAIRAQGGTRTIKVAQRPAANEPHTQLAAFEASHRRFDSSGSSSNDDDGDDAGKDERKHRKRKQRNSRYLANDDDDYRDETDGDRSGFVKEEKVTTFNCNDNLRLYGCRHPKAAFDIYARCAISVCMIGPGDDSTAMGIRDQAQRIWRSVPRTDKVEWDHLFKLRHSNVDIFRTGHELLKKQGMLAKLKPDYDTATKSSIIKQPCIEQATPKGPKSMSSIQHVPDQVPSKSRITPPALFPFLTLATSQTPRDQPCYVSFAYRVNKSHT